MSVQYMALIALTPFMPFANTDVSLDDEHIGLELTEQLELQFVLDI